MVYDSAATRARLLAAAYEEFVEFGLAGARVERIAAAASANKQAIYAYFGGKDALFDAVVEHRLQILFDLVPFTPDDLAGYFGTLFDKLMDNPGMLRLTQWQALERPQSTELERAAHIDKAQILSRRYGVDVEDGIDFMMFARSALYAWHLTPSSVRGTRRVSGPTRVKRHRAAFVKAIDALAEQLLGLEAN